MTTQVIRSVAHGVRDVVRGIRKQTSSDEFAMFLLSATIFYTMWYAMKPII